MKGKCTLCDGRAKLVKARMRGYIEGTTFDIYECKHCNVACSDPRQTDEVVYDTFYKNAVLVPGYERYERYAELVIQVRRPLAALSASEPIYWSASAAITAAGVPERGAILEVGSGLGYYVYALRQDGYDATGVDISSEAVDRATASYGPHFHTEDIFTFAEQHTGTYDCVLMLETIEHVEDPVSFIRAGMRLLNEHGVLIITTPNKDRFSASPWSMDPPVHLWSFSEAGLRTIARSMGKQVSFVDFTPYTKRFSTHTVHQVSDSESQPVSYRITRDGDLAPWFRVGTGKRWLGVYLRHTLSVLWRRIRPKKVSAQIPTLCSVIRNTSTDPVPDHA